MNKQLCIELYKKMFLSRKSEEFIIRHYPEDEMKTPMHMSMGEEAIVIGISHALKDTDQVFGTYRSHALYLSKTLDLDDFFLELYGKDTSLLKGKGGSMHLCSPKHGFMGASAIVGSIIPVAVGAAYANLVQDNDKIAVAFFGDGAIDEGVFWESLNVACLMKLPVMLVCEDNGYAVHSPTSTRHGYNSITDIVEKFNCKVFSKISTDAEEIYNMTKEAVKHIKDKQGPCFLHLKYYRYLEHVGVNYDFNAGYRKIEEFKEWEKIDPINLMRKKLEQFMPEEKIKEIEDTIENSIIESVKKAKNAPFADKCVLYEEVI